MIGAINGGSIDHDGLAVIRDVERVALVHSMLHIMFRYKDILQVEPCSP